MLLYTKSSKNVVSTWTPDLLLTAGFGSGVPLAGLWSPSAAPGKTAVEQNHVYMSRQRTEIKLLSLIIPLKGFYSWRNSQWHLSPLWICSSGSLRSPSLLSCFYTVCRKTWHWCFEELSSIIKIKIFHMLTLVHHVAVVFGTRTRQWRPKSFKETKTVSLSASPEKNYLFSCNYCVDFF